MPRNPELDKLLREVDSLTGTPSEAEVETQENADLPKKSESGSSFLKSVGSFFITTVDDEEAEQADTPPPSPNTVASIANATSIPEFSSAGSDDFSSRSFADIYHEGGIDESSFTVDKLNVLLQDASLKDQPISTKTLVLKMALKAQNVEPSVPITDAVQRDRSLDAYQRMLNTRAKQTEESNSQAIQQINEEVKEYLEAKNAEMDKLRAETQEMKRQAEAFASRRSEEERRLAEIVIPLLEGQPNPISIGNEVD